MSRDMKSERKEKWVQYAFWFLAGVLVTFVIFFLIKMLCEKTTITIPPNYNYAIEDHYTKNENLWSTYYVYDDYVLVTKDTNEESPIMAYDGIGASGLVYDENDIVESCDEDSCYEYPQVLNTIKKFISNKFGREYTGR